MQTKLVMGKWTVQDEKGTVYGTYGSESDAKQAASDWQDYYANPLVF